MKKLSLASLAAASAALCASSAIAHVGLLNTSTPVAFPASTFAVAGTTNVIQFNAGHGCTLAESVPTIPGAGANLDTTKLEITIPAAIVTATTATSVRALHSGSFGNVVKTVNGDGTITFTFNKIGSASAADDQYYNVRISFKLPAATLTDITKYQFLAVQTCASGGTDYVMNWGAANSPKLTVFPDKRKGFNKYTLDSQTVTDFTAASGTATLAAKLKAYFGDADMVWVGKSAYSPNPNTKTKIDALAVKDTTYSELGNKAGASIATTDTIWVKY
jgi:hypothetical protein